MTKRCLIKEVKEAAKRHPNDVVVQALIKKLELQQKVARHNSEGEHIANPLWGPEMANNEEPGLNLMLNPDSGLFNQVLRNAYIHHEVAVITDCLVTALGALGERL